MAFDPYAGPDGDLRSILILPRSPAAEQHARVLKRVSANNINLPTILEYRMRNGELQVVLTWVRGMDLQRYLEEVHSGCRRRPSATEAFRLVRGLAHGLGQLHRRHAIIHGDIKPANLILASNPEPAGDDRLWQRVGSGTNGCPRRRRRDQQSLRCPGAAPTDRSR